MKPSEVIEYFGNATKAAASIGVSQQCVRHWGINGRIPKLSQLAIQTVTKGKLKADEECFK